MAEIFERAIGGEDMEYRPSEKIMRRASYFYPIASKLEKSFKNLRVYLYQAKYNMSVVEHISYSLYVSTLNTLYLILALLFLYIITHNSIFLTLIPASLLIFIMMFYTVLFKPKVVALRIARKIEEELPYALRHLLIEVKSGVPLYQGLISISSGYGMLSEEFKDIVKKINSGVSMIKAIEDSVIRSASLSYRRAFWQILNSLKTGTDVEKPLEEIVKEIVKEQIIAIKNYGQQLNPLTLMYMMIAVIMPSLGITFLMIISSFISYSIPTGMLWGVVLFLIFFQWMFINLIKSRRPNVKV